jgi:DNA-binding MarR family transcriptional regulator
VARCPASTIPSMTDQHTLVETERAMQSHVTALELDFEAAHAVSSIYRAANAVRAHVTNEVLRPVGITWTGFVVLWVVWIWDGLETRHAAESAAISKATLTGVVKTLEARGWIKKQGRKDDRRLVELHLTPSGKALMEELYPQFNAIEAKVVSGISRKRQKDMTTSLRAIVTAIESADGLAEVEETA